MKEEGTRKEMPENSRSWKDKVIDSPLDPKITILPTASFLTQ
jgi:hypothetical protein